MNLDDYQELLFSYKIKNDDSEQRDSNDATTDTSNPVNDTYDTEVVQIIAGYGELFCITSEMDTLDIITQME